MSPDIHTVLGGATRVELRDRYTVRITDAGQHARAGS